MKRRNPTVSSKSKEGRLAESTDMAAVEGTVDVDVPISSLWEAFAHANWWPRWNSCMLWVRNRDLVLGRQLLWAFRPIRRWYPYVLPAIAKIVEVKDEDRVTWEITALPGFYARHTYYMKDLGSGRTRFGSWEKAMGRGFRLTKWFWIPHFVFVKDRSLEGTRFLEAVYLREGRIVESALSPERYRTFPRSLLLLLPVLAGAATLWWFYDSYLRQRVVELAPGVYAVFGGGGNSLIVRAEEEVLLERAMSERNPLFSWRLELRRSAGKLSSGRESMIAVDSLLFLGEGPPFPETRDGAMGQEYGERKRDKVRRCSRPIRLLGASLAQLTSSYSPSTSL